MGDLDQPSVGELRARLGLPPPSQTPNLQTAMACEEHAWMLFRYVAAHLTYAARTTVGEACAPFVAQEQLHEWAEAELDLNGLADELILEAADYRPR